MWHWSEEAPFKVLVGKGGEEASVNTAVDRYMRLANAMGATIVSPTVVRCPISNFTLRATILPLLREAPT